MPLEISAGAEDRTPPRSAVRRASRNAWTQRPVCHHRTGTIRAPAFPASRRRRATAGRAAAGMARAGVRAPEAPRLPGDLQERASRSGVPAAVMESCRRVIVTANCPGCFQAWGLPAVREDTDGVSSRSNPNMVPISGGFTLRYAVISSEVTQSPRHKMPLSRYCFVPAPGGDPLRPAAASCGRCPSAPAVKGRDRS